MEFRFFACDILRNVLAAKPAPVSLALNADHLCSQMKSMVPVIKTSKYFKFHLKYETYVIAAPIFFRGPAALGAIFAFKLFYNEILARCLLSCRATNKVQAGLLGAVLCAVFIAEFQSAPLACHSIAHHLLLSLKPAPFSSSTCCSGDVGCGGSRGAGWSFLFVIALAQKRQQITNVRPLA